MSEFVLLHSHHEPGSATIEHLASKVGQRLLHLLGCQELPADVRKRLDAELAWIEQSGMAASWLALTRLVEVGQERRIPLGAPLGGADGTLIGAALCSLPNPVLGLRPLPSEAQGN